MSRHLMLADGMWLGSSSACNLVACVRLAKALPKGSTIVTILCDSGARHQSKVSQLLREDAEYVATDIRLIPPVLVGRIPRTKRSRSIGRYQSHAVILYRITNLARLERMKLCREWVVRCEVVSEG